MPGPSPKRAFDPRSAATAQTIVEIGDSAENTPVGDESVDCGDAFA
jgi:hypothetical protein